MIVVTQFKTYMAMKINIQSVNFDASVQLKDFIAKKVNKLEKYSEAIIDAEIILKVVKPEVADNKEASLKLNVKQGDMFASKVGNSFEEAVDLAVEAVEKQLVKFKEKIQSK